jgi:hypothetical protein
VGFKELPVDHDVDPQFALSYIPNCNLFLVRNPPEDKRVLHDIDLKAMVAGEAVTVHHKHRDSTIVKKWTAPGVITSALRVPQMVNGNEKYFARFWFMTKDLEDDDSFDKAEVPYVLIKCVRMYLEAVNRYESLPFWEICPEHCRFSSSSSYNHIVAFLKSETVNLKPDAYVPFADFQKAYKAYVIVYGMVYKSLTRDEYNDPFTMMNIRYNSNVPESLEYPRGSAKTRKCKFIHGCDLI